LKLIPFISVLLAVNVFVPLGGEMNRLAFPTTRIESWKCEVGKEVSLRLELGARQMKSPEMVIRLQHSLHIVSELPTRRLPVQEPMDSGKARFPRECVFTVHCGLRIL
jgi:hypothetical protein